MSKKAKVVGGVDYSLSSPAICVHIGNEWQYENCKFFYFGKSIDNIGYYDYPYPKWNSPQERYEKLSEWAVDILKDCDYIGLEGYAYSGSGKVFHIAENTGQLKQTLYNRGLSFEEYPPKVIKKFASGNGNAGKLAMNEAFIKDNNVDLREVFELPKSKDSPASDIIDAYYICRYRFSDIGE